MWVNWPVRQNDGGNGEQGKAEIQRRKWTGKMNQEVSTADFEAGGGSISSGLGPPLAVKVRRSGATSEVHWRDFFHTQSTLSNKMR